MIYEKCNLKSSVFFNIFIIQKKISMKKYLLLLILLLGSFYVKSQDLKNIRTMVVLKQFEKAKPEIDKYLADPKNSTKGEGWYYKAYIYNAFARLAGKTADESKALFTESFNALKKYAELEPKAPLTVEEENSTIYNVYYGLYDEAVKAYNTKNFPLSYDFFTRSLNVHDYAYNNHLNGPSGLKFAAHDTDLVWNLAVLANELKKNEDALVYYKKIVDVGLSDEKYAVAYDELIKTTKKEKNAELFNKYVTLAKKYYPVDKAYWESQQIDFAVNGLEGEALLNKYEELTKTLPDNYGVLYDYAIEIDKFLGTDAAKGKDAVAYKNKMEDLFLQAAKAQSSIEVNLQLANLYYSKSYDFQDRAGRIKGTKPAEVKLKKDLTDSVKLVINKSVPYAEKAASLLADLKTYKYSDKANYKLALEILGNAAKANGNAAKAAEYEKKRADIDKL
jgi:hypothetical protein